VYISRQDIKNIDWVRTLTNSIVGKNMREFVLGISCSVILTACGGSGGVTSSAGTGVTETPEVFVVRRYPPPNSE